jgi:hypothetical protein
MRGDRTSVRAARISGNAMRRKRSLPHGDAALKKESADLIDDAGELADQPLTHAVLRLQIKLVGILCGDEFHRTPDVICSPRGFLMLTGAVEKDTAENLRNRKTQ